MEDDPILSCVALMQNVIIWSWFLANYSVVIACEDWRLLIELSDVPVSWIFL